VDAVKSFNLCNAALSVATYCLSPGGNFLCKIFQGEDTKEFMESVREKFVNQRNFKPKSSRKASNEIYIIGIGKK
jgi:23S rRNA (uridine2552-2'-O)-methyltransferase